jgi:hypothetical protein
VGYNVLALVAVFTIVGVVAFAVLARVAMAAGL